MKKVLIAVMCCHARQDFAEASRQTWIKNIQGADYKIFYGSGESGSRSRHDAENISNRELKPDEIQLDVPDSYLDVCIKIHEIIRWAYDHGYDYLMKLDDDTYLHPDRLLASNFYTYDFVGGDSYGIDEHNRIFHFEGGVNPSGPAFWLSRKAMEIVLHFPRPQHASPDEPWLGWLLRSNGTQIKMVPYMGCYGNLPLDGGAYEFVNCGLPEEKTIIAEWEFNPEKMRMIHQQWQAGTRRLPQAKPIDPNKKLDMTIGSIRIKNPA